jgi:hypothetical protein
MHTTRFNVKLAEFLAQSIFVTLIQFSEQKWLFP